MNTNVTLSLATRESIRDEIGKQRANLGSAEFERALNVALADYTGDTVAREKDQEKRKVAA